MHNKAYLSKTAGLKMASQQALSQSLNEKFGLRNVRDDWFRRQTAFSSDVLVGPICRTDLCKVSQGSLPWNILEAHSVQLNVKVLVQIEDVINIASADPRSADMPRVLQMTLTDGALDFVAVELESLGGRLSMRTVPGTKLILLPTALVRRGRILLTSKDFSFLGGPSNNVWGDAYNERIAESLRAAGLPNPKASTFDTIASASGNERGNMASTSLIDMGGIADAIPSTEDNDDDDEFWAEAAAAVDRSGVDVNINMLDVQSVRPSTSSDVLDRPELAENLAMPRSQFNPQVEGEMPRATAPSQLISAEATDVVRYSGADDDVEVVSVAPSSHSKEVQNVIINESDGDIEDSLDIPEMPRCESDPSMDREKINDTGNCAYVASASDMEDIEDLQTPGLPFCRFETIEVDRIEGALEGIYKAYSLKTSRKTGIKMENNQVMVSALLDDGTNVQLIALRPNFAKSLTGIDQNSEEFHNKFDEGVHEIRRCTRGMCGFFKVEHDDDGSFIADMTSHPPGCMVSCLLVWKTYSKWDMRSLSNCDGLYLLTKCALHDSFLLHRVLFFLPLLTMLKLVFLST